MKISLCQYDHRITIENDRDDLTLDQVIDELVYPLLVAAGFGDDAVAEALKTP